MAFSKKSFALALTLVAGAVAVYAWRQKPEWARDLLSVGLWATGNAKGCSLADCLDRVSTRISAAEKKIAKESVLLDKTPEGLEHWKTPLGEFYNRPPNPLHFLIAEQIVDVYDSGGCDIRKGDLVLDCGANVGTFTRKALNAGAGRVVTFEVDPRNNECLRKTYAAEIAAGRVTVIEKGVWDREDRLTLYLYDNAALNSVVMNKRVETDATPAKVEVSLTTIDRAVQELGLKSVGYIKLDIEGAERQALAGARQTIQRFQPRLSIATENLPDDIEVLPRVVASFGLGYRQKNGPCRNIRRTAIRPETVCLSVAGK